MKKFKLTTLLALMVSMGSFGAAAQGTNSMLQCKIEAPLDAAAGGPVKLKFILTNAGRLPLAVLKWNTPLEGWFGKSFNVTRNGEGVTYQGAMVKRFRPLMDDYAMLAPGQSVDATVNMAEGYDMKAPGQYKLMFSGRLQDVQELEEGQPFSNNRKLYAIACNELTVNLQ